MGDRVYYSTDSFTRSTSSSTALYGSTKVSLTFTPTLGKNYAIFWRALVDCSTAVVSTVPVRVRLQNVTDSVTLGEQGVGAYRSTVQRITAGGLAFHTTSQSTLSHTYSIQYYCDSSLIWTGVSEAQITAIELTTDDKFAVSSSISTSTSTTYVTKASILWTPSSADDYLIFASGDIGVGNFADGKCRIFDGVTAYSENTLHDWRITSSNRDYYYYGGMARAVGISTAQMWSNQFAWVSGSSAATYRNGSILALRMVGFDKYYWAEDRTAHISSTAVFVDYSASISSTSVSTVAHFVLATGMVTSTASGQTQIAGNKLIAAGSDVGSFFNQDADDVGYYYNWANMRLRTEVSDSVTWKLAYARSTGSSRINVDEAVLAVLQLDATPPTTSTSTGGVFISEMFTSRIFGSYIFEPIRV